MVTILPRLRQVRKDPAKLLDREAVEQAYREAGLTRRKRKLDPWSVLHLFLLQVLHQNTAITHLPHLSSETFTPSAYGSRGCANGQAATA